jgi:hypothetical protein
MSSLPFTETFEVVGGAAGAFREVTAEGVVVHQFRGFIKIVFEIC